MEEGRKWDPKAVDVSKPEEEVEEGEGHVEEAPEVRLLRSVLGSCSRPKLEVSTYDGSLTTKNWID